MAERNSYETNKIYPNVSLGLPDDQQFSLNKINEIKDNFLLRLKKEN